MQSDDSSGTFYDYTPTLEEIVYLENSVKSCPEMSIYARVDVFLDDDNKLAFTKLSKGK